MIFFIQLFNNTINPQINEYSLHQQAITTIKQVNALITRTITLSNKLNSSTTIKIQLPKTLNKNQYRIYARDNQLCLRTSGYKIITKCVNTTQSIIGNYLSGTELKIIVNNGEATISNDIPLYEPVYFYPECNKEIVDWDDYYLFSRSDNIGCGCEQQLDNNKLTNGGFEQQLTNWAEYVDSSNDIIEITTNKSIEGTHALYLKVPNDDFNDNAWIRRMIPNFNGLINISVYSANESSGSSFIGSIISSTQNDILYVFYISGGISAYCNGLAPNNNHLYIKCFNLETNKWQTITLNPLNDFIEIFNETIFNKTIEFKLGLGGNNSAYFDNVKYFINSEGKYCDTTNSGLANGACLNNNCSPLWLGYLIDDQLFPNNAVIRFNSKSLSSDNQCNITINGVNHELILNREQSYYDEGEQPINNQTIRVKCNNNENKTYNISINWIHLLSRISPVKNYFNFATTPFAAFGRIMNQELLVTIDNHPNPAEFILMSLNGSIIYNSSLPNNKEPTSLLLSDINNDSLNELIIKSYNATYVYSNNITLMWSYEGAQISVPFGLSTGDLLPDNGLEIATQGHNITILNSSGDVKFTKNSFQVFSYKQELSPVISDINGDGKNEIITFVDNNLTIMNGSGFILSNSTIQGISSYYETPAVGEINQSSEGLEVVYVTNSSKNLTVYLLNSTLGVMWERNIGEWDSDNNDYISYTDNLPQSIIIGDVTGDKQNDIIISLVNTSGDDYTTNDKVIILNYNGSLINEINFSSSDGGYPVIAELNPWNPGYELVIHEKDHLIIMNTTTTLNNISGMNMPGPATIITDINGDGKNEITSLNTGGDTVYIIKTNINSTNNKWLSAGSNNKQQYYKQLLPDLDYSKDACESYGYSWVNNQCCGDDWLNDNYDGCTNGVKS